MLKLGENIAATVAGLKATERTQAMLEASEAQAEMLRAQEEMLRQGLEGYLIKEKDLEREREALFRQNLGATKAKEEAFAQELEERDQEIARLKARLAQ
jgi:SMC interacting uncharacterized protein involved in chromosome segregation